MTVVTVVVVFVVIVAVAVAAAIVLLLFLLLLLLLPLLLLRPFLVLECWFALLRIAVRLCLFCFNNSSCSQQ